MNRELSNWILVRRSLMKTLHSVSQTLVALEMNLTSSSLFQSDQLEYVVHLLLSSALFLLLVVPIFPSSSLLLGSKSSDLTILGSSDLQDEWIRHSAVILAGYLDPVPEDSEGEGRKMGEAGEGDRVEVFSDKCGNI